MGKKLLLVEGKDDEHVLKHICGNRGGFRLDEIKSHQGVDNLIANLAEELRAAVEENDVVGVVVDADVDLPSRWTRIRNQIIEAGYSVVPEHPDVEGTIVLPPNGSLLPRAGVWIMPNNETRGILEDFLKFLVPHPDELLDYAQKSVNGIPDVWRQFRDLDRPKALIHTWLAWQENPGQPYGTAITSRFLNPEVPEVDVLVSWLKRLYLFDSDA